MHVTEVGRLKCLRDVSPVKKMTKKQLPPRRKEEERWTLNETVVAGDLRREAGGP